MCISSGRECEGYRNLPDKRTRAARRPGQAVVHVPILAKATANQQCSRSLSISKASSSLGRGSLVDLTPAEGWYLDHFRRITSPRCGGYFYDEFWHRLVHQLSEDQPAVRHAVIAMSARHSQIERLELGQVSSADEGYLSLQQCNKAITCLREYLSKEQSGRSPKEVVLATCVVLVYLALLEEDAHAADYHFQSGNRLLQEWQKDNFEQNPNGPAFLQAFSDLYLHRSTCADPKTFVEDEHPSLSAPCPEQVRPRKSIDNSETVNHFIVILGWVVLQSNRKGFSIGPATSFIRSGEASILSMLRLWRIQLKRSVMVHGNDVPHKDRDALTIFALWSEVIYIKVTAGNQPGSQEMRYDGLLSRFQRAVILAKTFLTAPTEKSTSPTFPAKTAIIPPLIFCASKCRDWFIRHQILLLLRGLRDQGDLWVSGTITVLERLIEIESEGITPGEKVPESSRVDSVFADIRDEDSKLELWYRHSRAPGGNHEGFWRSEILSIPAS
ncbi:uncharacterized protein TRUGW13939_01459 [Talaromyces rugulosus]|uniref:Transcription factor domain-containing protein n=1 Tax=Talaromyces rugulosus TaxID=121627 RepID=A0A7H8QMH0_TALRU|nr:uncharacterized protein TRUGW13939_01459 [Talaromyces rugulosus]QKX54373.1 hypothetical protein TRUGW13939_01459 [Talaromyces rugulosus]